MGRVTSFYLPTILLALAHLAGLIVAAVLLSRRKGPAPFLALVAFALLVLLDAGRIAETAFLPRLLPRVPRAMLADFWLMGGINCCCSLLDAAAIGCLIAALWLGIGGSEPEKEAPQEEVTSG